MKKISISFQLFLSILCVIIAISIYLVATHLMDQIMHPKTSNFLGIIIDNFMDFILQSLVFLGTIRFTMGIVSKFVMGKLISAVAAILIFNLYYDSFKKYRKATIKTKNKDKDKTNTNLNLEKLINDRILHLRILAMATTSVFISFPLRKFWIYT